MRTFVVSALLLAVLSLLLGFVVHATLLADEYLKLPSLFRPQADAQNYFPFMLLAHLLIGIGMTWIYRQGHSQGLAWPAQGVRFGIAWAIGMTLPLYLIYYAVQPMPGSLVMKQILFDAVAIIIMALACAFINRNANRSAFA